jgi:hypothetical protein
MQTKPVTRTLLVIFMTALLLVSSAAGLAMGQLVRCPETFGFAQDALVEGLKNQHSE